MSNSARPLAVVTGATSGIGLELAKQFAKNGFDLVITGYSRDPFVAAAELTRQGVEVETVQVDLSTRTGVDELYTRIKALGRPVDAIALNAGMPVGGHFVHETSLDDELKLIGLNVVSVVHLAKHIARDMVVRGEGRMLFTSSIIAQTPAPFQLVYAASKAFVQSFAQGLREELKDTGVSVTALMPGITDTNFFDRGGMEDTIAAQMPKDDPAKVAEQGFEALMAGKDHVVGGNVLNKVASAVSKVMPDSLKAAQTRKVGEKASNAAEDRQPD
jgi:short-subunit dehydrogenase